MPQGGMIFEFRGGAQSGGGALPAGKGDGAIQRDDRRRIERVELIVLAGDVGPIGGGEIGRSSVGGGDAGFQVVRGKGVAGRGAVQKAEPFGDAGGIPEGAVLPGEEQQAARVSRCGRARGPIAEEQCQQGVHDRRAGGGMMGQQAREANGLLAENSPAPL